MRINKELILRCSSKNLLPAHGGDEEPQGRITHLYLQEQYIRKIENLEVCLNLKALYLYDNKIDKIENLEQLENLNCLYLQSNRLRKLENLQPLTQLTVLLKNFFVVETSPPCTECWHVHMIRNVSYNAIPKLEGLETLCELRELYVQFQRIPEDQPLHIEPESIAGVADTLKVLNVSGNGLQSLHPLRPLVHLEILLAEENDVKDLDELVDIIADWRVVNQMRLNGNPVCKMRKYRDNVVVNCLELEELDGRVVSQSYRNFLLNWKQCQTLQNRKKESYEVLKPFLEEQIHNKQLSPPRPTPVNSRPGSSSQSESSSTSAVKPRSKSCQRKDRSSSRTRSLQEMPMKLVKRLTRSRK